MWCAHHEPEHAMKFRSTTARVVAALAVVLLLLTALPFGSARAAINQQQTWTNLYSGAVFPGTYSYTVAAGSQRVLVVAVSSSISAAAVQTTATVTYGGQNLTRQVGDLASVSRTHTYLFYLKDTPAVMDGLAHNLAVTIAGGISSYNFVYAAVYMGVDQSANPITSSQNFNSLSTSQTAVGPFASGLTIGNGDQAVEIINLTQTAIPAQTITVWAVDWFPGLGPNSALNLYSSYVATDSTAGTTTSQHTASGNTLSSMSAMSMKAFTTTPLCSPDGYEPDNLYSQATTLLTNGTTQDHLNTPPTDQDWFKFQAVAGHPYDIRTMLLNDIDRYGNAANDTLLYLYGTDGVTQLGFNDDVNYATWYIGYYYYRESWITWTAPASGWYYVQELQWGPTAGNTINDCHSYRIWVQDNTPPTPTFTPTRTYTPTNTPTNTPTFTPTFTPTITRTPMPLAGATFVQYSAMLLNAPDFGLNAQTVSGRINGGVRPYTVVVHIISPDKTVGNNGDITYTPTVQPDGTFVVDVFISGNTHFGCDYQGIWQAYFEISDSGGHNATSTTTTWAVSFPRVHAIP
jgi:hypothetical protein